MNFLSSQVLHQSRTVAPGSASRFAAANTSATPAAITPRAFSGVSFPARPSFAARSHTRQISSACFLTPVLVDRNTRLPSGSVKAQNQNGRPACRCILAIPHNLLHNVHGCQPDSLAVVYDGARWVKSTKNVTRVRIPLGSPHRFIGKNRGVVRFFLQCRTLFGQYLRT